MRRVALVVAAVAVSAVLCAGFSFLFLVPPALVEVPVAADAPPPPPSVDPAVLPPPPDPDAARDPTKRTPEELEALLAQHPLQAQPPPDRLPDLPPPADDRPPLSAAELAEARRNGSLGADPTRLRRDQIGAEGDLRLRPGQQVPPVIEEEHPPDTDRER